VGYLFEKGKTQNGAVMKVIHVINSLNTGGAEKLVLDTLPKYLEKDIDVELILLNGFEYPFLKKFKRDSNVVIHGLSKRSLYNPIIPFKIAQIIRDAQIVHVHLFPAQYWVVIAKWLSRSKAKLVFTEHNTWNRRLGNRILRILDKRIYHFYAKIVCISEEVRKILKEHTGYGFDQLVVIQNGVDLSKIKMASSVPKTTIHPKIEPSDILLLMVAGFRVQKDQKTLIRSLEKLPENVKLLFVGDGVERQNCEDLVGHLNLSNRVIFLGWRMDVPELLKTVDIVILSSYYEGLSLSSIEGMASGKPFVASDVPGLQELVSGNGLLFPQGDEVALSKCIMSLLDDEHYYQSVVEKCLLRAMDFDISLCIEEHIKLYNSIIN
jgi:glycosyltransferase involved in cell wall biosynthesis